VVGNIVMGVIGAFIGGYLFRLAVVKRFVEGPPRGNERKRTE
jgi:uncharacterized membrane protein YeaQ/YmgE (transglycosylase-associated protein family)